MQLCDLRSRQWNMDQIVCVSPVSTEKGGPGDLLYDVELKNGDVMRIPASAYSDLMNTPAHVLPAESGYSAVSGWDEEGAFLEPVLGWAVTIAGSVVPITVDGINVGLDHAISILLPDGRVQKPEPNARTYKSLDDFLAVMNSGSGSSL